MPNITIRPAAAADVPRLRTLIDASVRGLHTADYTPAQIERALTSVYGVDSQLIADGTYFVAEAGASTIAGCGGWSKRATLYGGDQWTERENTLLDPLTDAAKIRAFFVHPDWTRRAVGSRILQACERAAHAAGFRRLEIGATLTGVPFYAAHAYTVTARADIDLGDIVLPIVYMEKRAT